MKQQKLKLYGQTLRLNAEAWRQLKILAMDNGTTTHALVIDALDAYLSSKFGVEFARGVTVTYLMVAPDSKLIKCGISNNPYSRLAQHRATAEDELDGLCPKNLELVRAWNADRFSESALLFEAAQHFERVAQKSEWFKARDDKQISTFLMDVCGTSVSADARIF